MVLKSFKTKDFLLKFVWSQYAVNDNNKISELSKLSLVKPYCTESVMALTTENKNPAVKPSHICLSALRL